MLPRAFFIPTYIFSSQYLPQSSFLGFVSSLVSRGVCVSFTGSCLAGSKGSGGRDE